MSEAVKRPATVDEQLGILRARGMCVDERLARQWLASVSYYRLSGYWYPYRRLSASEDSRNPQRIDEFEPGTTFVDNSGALRVRP